MPRIIARHHTLLIALVITTLPTITSAQPTPYLVQDPSTGSSDPTHLTPIGDRLAFYARDEIFGMEMRITDGTPAGTHLVKDVVPGPQPYNVDDLNFFPPTFGITWTLVADLSGLVMFINKSLEPGDFYGLWLSNGPASDAVEVTSWDFFFRPLMIVSGGNQAFMSLWGEIWRTDGTSVGTYRAAQLQSSNATSFLRPFAGRAYYWDADGATVEVRSCDGAPDSTQRLASFNRHLSVTMSRTTDHVLFNGRDNDHGIELWAASLIPADDGALVVDIWPGPDSSEPGEFAHWGDRALFSADDGLHGRELWLTNGTPGGTYLLADIAWGPNYSDPEQLTPAGPAVFFTADDGYTGRELWVTEGPVHGTRQLTDLAPGFASIQIGDMLGHRGMLYFVAATPDEGLELWQSDGTAAGTFRHTDIAPGPTSSEPRDLTIAGDKLYFSAFTADHGRELWALDLPAAGDLNADFSFTADDAQRFFTCLRGCDVATVPFNCTLPEFGRADIDQDIDVDTADLATFQRLSFEN
jgi:ELWxxDGT repeat protein